MHRLPNDNGKGKKSGLRRYYQIKPFEGQVLNSPKTYRDKNDRNKGELEISTRASNATDRVPVSFYNLLW